jgi:hypothetical protein
MEEAVPRYVIFVNEADVSVMYTAPLESDDAAYFLKHIFSNLRPLSNEQYANGPAAILHTLAKSSYILHQKAVYWCVEWEPGLVVIRFTPDKTMNWTALRSPVPTFGHRLPTQEDLRDYDENATNHQYNLVFHAWDAQFEEDMREYRGFSRADEDTLGVYRMALEHVNALGEELQLQYSQDADFQQWLSQAKSNLAQRAGDGIRVKR